MAFQEKPTAFLIGFMAIAGVGTNLQASTETAHLCELAAADIARTSGIPADLLRALTLTETGRQIGGSLRPWPWAINHAGTGHWFDTQGEMLAYAQDLLAQGNQNFDLGCFQLNYRWHGERFASLEHMTDPLENARYAAGYLTAKHQETGSWDRAVGAYHSGTAALAQTYLTRFLSILADLGPVTAGPDVTPVATPVSDRPRENAFPLLIAGRSGTGPSLFPQVTAGRRLIGGAP